MHAQYQMRCPYLACELVETFSDVLRVTHDRSEQQRIGCPTQLGRWRRLEESGSALELAGLAQPFPIDREHPMYVILDLVPGLIF